MAGRERNGGSGVKWWALSGNLKKQPAKNASIIAKIGILLVEISKTRKTTSKKKSFSGKTLVEL